jgi:septum formation protein
VGDGSAPSGPSQSSGPSWSSGSAPPPRLVLASSSPRRRELLARLGLHPTIRPADVDETVHDGEIATELVVRLASAKAAASASAVSAASARTSDEVVLAADTVVVLDEVVLGKPRDDDEAASMLAALSGRTHEVITGIAVRHGDHDLTDLVTTHVTFRDLTDREVAWYVATGEPADKAGAYALQGAGAVLVERVEGSDTNVIGLPLAETVALLRAAGFETLCADAPR